MRIGDLKRAVEDVILKPDENSLAELSKRDTIAALDLCRVDPTSSIPAHVPSAATMNNCSCSSETVPNEIPQRQPPQLCTSTSLDTIMNRPQPIFHRHSAGVSRRQSKVISSLQSKRKRSNSLTNYNKSHGQSVSLPQSARQTPMRFGEEELYKSSLGSSDSHSSIAKSEDYTRDFVAEEDESVIGQYLMTEGCSANSSCTTSANPFFSYRETREDEDMDCD